MNVSIDNTEINLDSLNSIFGKIRDIFVNVKPQEDMSIEELVQIYSNDEIFLKDLKYIKESLSDIEYILSPINDLEEEFSYFLTVKRMIDYLLGDIKLFIGNMSFIEKLLINFFHLIHQKLHKNDDYDNEFKSFSIFLNQQKEFFYTEIYQYGGAFEKTIKEINNLWM